MAAGAEPARKRPAASAPPGRGVPPGGGVPPKGGTGPAADPPRSVLAALRQYFMPAWLFLRAIIRRFLGDAGPQIAASLTYTSLLSMVPLLALSLAVIAIFPAFDGLRGDLREMFLQNVLPGAVSAVDDYLDTFTRNAGQLTAAGLGGLVVTSILLFVTIEDAFNRIWRVQHDRSLVIRLMSFWTLMSLGPLLFGISVSISGSVAAAMDGADGDLDLGGLRWLSWLVPIVLTYLGFFGLYWILPNYPVRWQHAAIGAAVASLLFEALKFGFGIYMLSVPTFQIIYGALSIIPILLIWTYLAWCVAVIGAVVAALLPDIAYHSRRPDEERHSHRKLEVALLLLNELRACTRGGRVLKLPSLVRREGLGQEVLDEVVGRLEAARIVIRRGRSELVLSRDLRHLRLYDLVAALHLLPGLTWQELPRADKSIWATDLQARMLRARSETQDALAVDLDAFLAQDGAKPVQAAVRDDAIQPSAKGPEARVRQTSGGG